jgi:hypothetical protein
MGAACLAAVCPCDVKRVSMWESWTAVLILRPQLVPLPYVTGPIGCRVSGQPVPVVCHGSEWELRTAVTGSWY